MTRLSLPIVPLFLGSLTLSAGLVKEPTQFFSSRINHALGRRTDDGSCGAQPKAAAPHQNIWAGLTNQELADAIGFLYNSKELNLTQNGGSWDNTLLSIDLLQPNKSDVLPFLAGTGTLPPRYASATLLFGSRQDPYIEDYYIGPLPPSNLTKAQPLNFLTTRKTNSKVWVPNADVAAYGNFTNRVISDAADIVKKLWDLEPDAVRLWDGSGTEADNGRTKQWSAFMGNPGSSSIHDSGTLLPLGLYLKTDVTGRDPSKWSVDAWLYDNVLYKSTDDFRTAVMQPGFKSLGANMEGLWAQLEKQGDTPSFDELPPPANVQSGPKRFSIDTDAQFVSWLDFSFYVAVSLTTGVKLFDVKYKGKRILYELGMEDALAHYAGNDPVQSGTCFSDIQGSGFGSSIVSLVNGYDCPSYSTYLNTTFMDGTTRMTQPNGICLFETDSGYPIQRHSWAGHTSITKNIAFTVRSVSTIGNYDYMTSFEFRMDGSILIAVRASGYIMTAFVAHNDGYGFHIHDNLSGSMHDHVLTFKADFDILGEENSFQKVEFVSANETYVWSEGKVRSTMKGRKSYIESEEDSQLNWSENGNSLYAIVNRDAQNQFGENPGYRFMPAATIAHFTIKNSTVTKKGANHADHHFYVTRQKDTEARASHPYNLMNPEEPVVNFAKFFDGESLKQEDLVLWFNLGMHHMPHTGDLPNTVFSTAYSGLIIEPFNYLPGDPSRATTQQIRIDSPVGGNRSVASFGAAPATCPVNMDQLNPKVNGPLGSVAVQKLPYDGTRPNHIG